MTDIKSLHFLCPSFKNYFNTVCSLFRGKEVMVLAFIGITQLVIGWLIFSRHSARLLKTRGHFCYKTHPNDYEGALKVVKKCFDKIVNPKTSNSWDQVYLSQKEEIFKRTPLKKVEGSCFGNCCALGKEIIRRGKILSAAELQMIECGDKFPKRAMGFQFMQAVSKEIRKRIDKTWHGSADGIPLQLTTEEKNILGKRASYFCYRRHIECLKTYGLSFQEVAEFSDEEFEKLCSYVIDQNLPFDWILKEKIFEELKPTTGKEFISWCALYDDDFGIHRTYAVDKGTFCLDSFNPLHSYPHLIYPKNSNVKNKKPFFLCDETLQKSGLIKECPEIGQADFSGFFIIAGSSEDSLTDSNKTAANHAVLLEIDNPTNRYVLYDNSAEIYSGESLDACLELLNAKWAFFKYKESCFFPYIFQNNLGYTQTT